MYVFNAVLGCRISSAVLCALLLCASSLVQSQGQTTPPSGASCVVSAGNRNAPLAPDGSYTVFGIPGNMGAIRARASCSDGSVGQSAIGFTNPLQAATIELGPIIFGQLDPVPIAAALSAPNRQLTTGETAQLSFIAVAANGTSRDVTLRSEGTTYSVSNALMATVTENGLITIYPEFAAGSSARVVASATAEGSVSSTYMFILGPRGTLGGVVLSADGVTPVSGAEVSVMRMQPMEQAGTVVTGTDGRFVLQEVNAGPFLISAIDPLTGDRALTAARIENEGENVQVSMRMNGLGTVDVRVVDAVDASVTGAIVTFTALGAYRDTRTATTNVEGIARFAGVAVGDFTVSTRDPVTRLVGTAVAKITAGEILPITLRLQPVGKIQGVVFDVNGSTLLAGIQVRIHSRARGILTQSVTAEDGAFSFDTLPISDGPFILDAFVDGRLRARVPGIVISQANATVNSNIILSSVGTVSGVVRDPGGAVFANARVTMQSLVGLRLSFGATTNSSGRFVLPAVPVGAFELLAVTEGGRAGRANGTVSADAELVNLDVVIADNSLVGTVYQRDGVTPVGAGVEVYLAPRTAGLRYSYAGVANVLNTQTNGEGKFGFRVESAGAYYVQAEQDLDRGRTEAIVVNLDPSQPLESRVVFLAKGTVSGVVRDANLVPQPNLPVVVRTDGAFIAERATQTDAAGHYVMAGVFAGDVSARASNELTQLAGISRGRIDAEGQAITLNVTLAATGSLNGRVLKRDGSVVPGPVRLAVNRNGRVFTALDLADGSAYALDLVPVGDIELIAEELATADKGVATTRISSANEIKTVDVRLVGQGRLNVSLVDINGTAVADAKVTVSTLLPFDTKQEVISDAAGLAVFERVFAGDFSISASKPAPIGTLSGSTAGLLLPGEVRGIEIEMTALATGVVRGTVFQADGVTPVGAGMVVRMLPEPFEDAFVTTTDAAGNYVYSLVPAGTYTIDALNFYVPRLPQTSVCPRQDRVRGRATGVTVASQDQEVVRDIQLIGKGQVSGQITDAGGNPMPGIEVRLTNPDPIYGVNVTCSGRTSYDQMTNASGSYLLADVPPGDFSITAENTSRTLRAEDRGRLSFDGDAVVVDMQLIDSAVSMPYTFYDANGFRFDITGNGAIGNGTNNVFGATAPDNAGERLEIVSQGIPVPFTNGDGSIGRLSKGAQQIEVDDDVPSGLHVTRSVFTPRAGYFTRYMEVLRNPSLVPITVSIRLKSHHRPANSNPRIVDSSDGDQILSVAGLVNRDRWVVIDDQLDTNPFSGSSIPATAHIFDGVGGQTQVASASYELVGQIGKLTYEWADVVVEPGQTVILMHFALNQLNRFNAREAALRLAQLPPEAIDDLTTDERIAIRNFAVPEQSTIEPLPNLDAGALTGRVLSGDGVTPVPAATVRFKSKHLLFARERFVTTNSAGEFAFRSTLDGTQYNYVIPIYAFDLDASYALSGASTAITPGDFPAHQTQTEQDLIFVGAGDVRGAVKRHSGALVPGAKIRLCKFGSGSACTDQIPNPSNQTTSKADGSFVMFANPPRDYYLFAEKDHPQRYTSSHRNILGAGSVSITAGDIAVADITMEQTGSVAGVIRAADGTPVVDADLKLWIGTVRTGLPHRVTKSDTAGRYRFFDVPVGSTVILAEDVISGAQGEVTVSVQVDQETEQDVQLRGFGAAHVQVLFARGTPAGNAPVAPDGRIGGVSDSNGQITLQLPVGEYTMRARHPNAIGLTQLSGTTATVITNNGDQVDVTVTLKPAGTVLGGIVRPDGTTLANGFPYTIRQIRGGSVTNSGSTSATGSYRVPGLPVGGYVITAYDAAQSRFADAEFDISEDGEELEINLVLLENRIALPATLLDANRFAFDVQHGGQLNTGSGAFANAAVQLQINGQNYLGATSAGLEADRRQFVIEQAGLISGLKVSRKIFVPRGAYFVRYLEVLENPSASPIQASVRLSSRMFNSATVATSSGDLNVDTNDNWVTLDDAIDDDIKLVNNQTSALAYVFSQAEGELRANILSLATVDGRPTLSQEWTNVTIAPGERVTLMHFAVQQINRAGSLAAAQRLSALPPEVLSFLSPEDISSIRNFVLPADGVSAVEALPALTASVQGIVYEGDIRTPVPSTRVTVQSTHPLFNRVWGKIPNPSTNCPPGTVVSSLLSVAVVPPNTPNPPALGSYLLQGQLTAIDSIALPEGVDVVVAAQQATPCFGAASGHPFTRLPSRVVSVPASVVQDVIFDSGILTGTINGPADFSVTQGRVYRSIDDPDPISYVFAPIAADATYVYPGLAPGSYDLLFDTQHPDRISSDQGLRGQRTPVQVTLGAITVTDISMQPTGGIQGAVITANGEASVNARVILEGAANDQVYDQCASGCAPETLIKHRGKRRVAREVRTDSLGRYALAAVPSGAYSLTVIDPISGSRNVVSPVVNELQTTVQNVTLLAMGSIELTVLNAAGAPVVDAYTYLNAAAEGAEKLVGRTNGQGRLTIANVPIGNYVVRVRDLRFSGQTFTDRTVAGNIVSSGQVNTHSLSMLAIASVAISVVDGDVGGAPVANADVSITDTRGPRFVGRTNASGQIIAGLVPVGNYTVNVVSIIAGVRKEGLVSGQIVSADDGLIRSANVDLRTASITLPRTFYDANRMGYTIDSVAAAGRLPRLSINGIAFTGASTGGQHLSQRQLNVAQVAPISGLLVTRKVHTPQIGYFARYLEVLDNPSTSAITVSVVTQSLLPTGHPSGWQLQATSSGDALISNVGADRDSWFTLTDQSQSVHLAVVSGALNAAQAAADLAFVYSESAGGYIASQTWNNVTVPANGRVVLMHFAVQQINAAGAVAAATRLTQLPPEVLAGLVAEDPSTVTNYLVPADLQSTLPALPELLGTIGGKVFEGDGVTPVANVSVTVRSQHPLFNREWAWTASFAQTLRTQADGSFAIAGVLRNDQWSIAIPQDTPVDFSATHPLTSLSATTSASFPADSNVLVQDLQFASGQIRGRVVGAFQHPVASGNVSIYRGSTFVGTVSLSPDASFSITGLIAGNYRLVATFHVANGTSSTAEVTGVAVTVGATVTQDITLPANGAVGGQLLTFAGQPVANASVTLTNAANTFSRNVTTNAAGNFAFNAVPVGVLQLGATDSRNGARISLPVTILDQQQTNQNLVFDALGNAHIQLRFASGAIVANHAVYARAPSIVGRRLLGNTGADGRLTALVPIGDFSVEATHPRTASLATALGNIAVDGGEAAVDLTLLPSARLRLSVRDAGGMPLLGASVRYSQVGASASLNPAPATDLNGQSVSPYLSVGRYTFSALDAAGQSVMTEFVVDASNDEMLVDRQVTIVPSDITSGVMSFLDQRQLYSIALNAGDRLALGVNGMAVGPTPAACTVRVQIYRANQLLAQGIGDGAPNFWQQNSQGDLRNLVATQSASYTIVATPAYSWCVTGGYGLNALVNGAAAPILAYQNGGSVVGQIIQPDGVTPLAGATIRLRTNTTPSANQQRISDANGAYAFDQLPIGGYSLSYLPAEGAVQAENGWLNSPAQIVTHNLILKANTVVNVTVVGADGQPFAQSVRVDFSADSFYQSIFTNASGVASLTYIGNSALRITAHHPTISGLTVSRVIPAADGQTVDITMALIPAPVTGRVLDPVGAPAGDIQVAAFDATTSNYLFAVQTDALGQFSFAALPAGTDVRLSAQDPVNGVRTSVTIAVLPGGTPAVDITLTGRGNIEVTVTNAAGLTVADAFVMASYEYELGTGNTNYWSGNTDSQGKLTMPNLPVGRPISLRADYFGNGGGSRPIAKEMLTTESSTLGGGDNTAVVTIAQHGDTVLQTLIVEIPGGTLSVQLNAADGLAIAGTCYLNLQASENSYSSNGDCDAPLVINGVLAGSYEFSVSGNDFYREEVAVEIVDQEVTDVQITLGVVRGVVTHSDASPATMVEVWVQHVNGDSRYASTDVSGNYRIIDVPLGAFTIEAQELESGLRTASTGSMLDIEVTQNIDLTLPPFGSVNGVVLDTQGQPVAQASVWLRSSGLDFQRYAESDTLGEYIFSKVALGDIEVAATLPDMLNLAFASGQMSAQGQAINLDLQFPVPGSVSGTLRLPDNTPAVGQCVYLRSLEARVGFSSIDSLSTSDATGGYQFVDVVPGRFSLFAHDCSDQLPYGLINSSVVSGETTIADLKLGNALRLTHELHDAVSGYRFSIYQSGSALAIVPPFYNQLFRFTSPSLQVDGRGFTGHQAALPTQEGRELDIGPMVINGLEISRRIYVPSSAGYVRWLETLRNTTATDIQIPLQLSGGYNFDTPLLQQGNSPSGGRYYLQSTPGPLDEYIPGPIAYVLNGKSSGLPSTLNFVDGQYMFNWVWNVTVPAGESVAYLHYIVVRQPGNTAAVATQAQALMLMTEPGMFDGLSPTERSQIQNFTVPE